MELNHQTELTSKTETLTDGRQADSWGWEGWENGEIKQKRKITHGHGQQWGDYGGQGEVGGWRWKRYREDNWKKCNENELLKKELKTALSLSPKKI